MRRDVIGVFNYNDGEMNVNESCEQRLGLIPGKTYHAFDFWTLTVPMEKNMTRVIKTN